MDSVTKMKSAILLKMREGGLNRRNNFTSCRVKSAGRVFKTVGEDGRKKDQVR